MDSLIKRPNRVPELQRKFQADKRPVYQRSPNSRFWMGAVVVTLGISLYGSTVALYNAAHGRKAEGAL